MCTIANELMLVLCYLERLYGHHRLFQSSERPYKNFFNRNDFNNLDRLSPMSTWSRQSETELSIVLGLKGCS